MSKLITTNDLQDILNEALPTPRYGGVQTASWTANSSSANNVKVTDSLHLVPGTYVITLKYPAVSANLWTTLFYSRDGGSSTLLDSFTVSQGISCSSHTYVINIPFELDVWAETATSTAITYTYKERGGLRAIQIAESKASSNEADYIIEQGTSGIWTYRKWNSGISECWGMTSATSIAVASWNAWGSIYEGLITTEIDYPTSLFTSYPSLTASAIARSTAGTMGIEISATGNASHTPYFYALRPNKPSAAITVSASIHAKGTWK